AVQHRANPALARTGRAGEGADSPTGSLGLGAALVARSLAGRPNDQRACRGDRRQAGVSIGVSWATVSRPGERLLRMADERGEETALQDHVAQWSVMRLCRALGEVDARDWRAGTAGRDHEEANQRI